jgi:hemerythrin
MSLFEWKDSYSIGVPELDVQHQKLYSLADKLHAAMNAGKSMTVMQQVLADLVTYTKTHFAAEERLLLKCGYPDLPAHKIKHDDFTRRVVEFQREYQGGKAMLSIETMQFLSHWLQQHIGGTDRKYVPFVARKAELSALR